MASSIPGARTALYAGLQALTATTLEGVGVYRTGKWTTDRVYDEITVVNAVDITREVMAMARPAPFREDFTLLVVVNVIRHGDGLQFVEDRLWDLITIVEQLVMGDPTLAGAVNQALPVAVDEEQSGPHSRDEDTVVASAVLRLECWARVHLN